MALRVLSLILAAALVAGASPHAAATRVSSPEGEDLALFNYLPRGGTAVDTQALFGRQPISRVSSTIAIAALGQICMLTSAGAPAQAMYPFGVIYRNAINFALGALNQGDTRADVVLASPAAASVHPFVVWALGPPPSRIGQLSNIPFLAAFGMFVAMGNVLGDPANEIFVGAGRGGPGRVYMLDVNRDDMFALDPFGAEYVGGVRVAAGDLDGDGYAELITSQVEGGKIKVFSYRSGQFVAVGQGSPFGRDFRGGVHVAAGDLNNDGRADLITGAGSGRAQVRAFSIGTTMSAGTRVSVLADFFAYDGDFADGVRVAAAKREGRPAIVATAGHRVRAFEPYESELWRRDDAFYPNPFGDIADILIGIDVFTPDGERIR